METSTSPPPGLTPVIRLVDVIYQTREKVFHQDIQTPRSGLKERGTAEFFDRLRGVWIPDETLF